MEKANGTKTIEISTKTIITAIALILGLLLLYIIRDILLLALVAITLASALEPLVGWAKRKLKLPRGLTVFIVYLVVLLGVGGGLYAIAPVFLDQFRELIDQYNSGASDIFSNTGPLQSLFSSINIGPALNSLFETFSGNSGGVFKTTLGFFTGALEFLAILVISFYLVVDQGAIKDMVRRFLPEKHKEKAVLALTTIQSKLGLWLLGQLILSVTIFVVTYIALVIIGINAPVALAALAGMFEILPFLGPFISAVPAILIALTQSAPLAVLVGIVYILIQKMEGYILVPKVMEKAVGVHPLMILFSILVGFKLAGIIGALLAVPVLAAGSVIIDMYVFGKDADVPKSPDVKELFENSALEK